MSWILIANTSYPYNYGPDYWSMGITVIGLLLIIFGIWKIYKSGEKGEGS